MKAAKRKPRTPKAPKPAKAPKVPAHLRSLEGVDPRRLPPGTAYPCNDPWIGVQIRGDKIQGKVLGCMSPKAGARRHEYAVGRVANTATLNRELRAMTKRPSSVESPRRKPLGYGPGSVESPRRKPLGYGPGGIETGRARQVVCHDPFDAIPPMPPLVGKSQKQADYAEAVRAKAVEQMRTYTRWLIDRTASNRGAGLSLIVLGVLSNIDDARFILDNNSDFGGTLSMAALVRYLKAATDSSERMAFVQTSAIAFSDWLLSRGLYVLVRKGMVKERFPLAPNRMRDVLRSILWESMQFFVEATASAWGASVDYERVVDTFVVAFLGRTAATLGAWIACAESPERRASLEAFAGEYRRLTQEIQFGWDEGPR